MVMFFDTRVKDSLIGDIGVLKFDVEHLLQKEFVLDLVIKVANRLKK